MINQELLNAIDVLSTNPMINSISLNMRSYGGPEISIQSRVDFAEHNIISLVERHLGELHESNKRIDFDHINCWGNSYRGLNNGVEITLITSTTKEEAPLPEGVTKENLLTDSTTTWDLETIMRQEG